MSKGGGTYGACENWYTHSSKFAYAKSPRTCAGPGTSAGARGSQPARCGGYMQLPRSAYGTPSATCAGPGTSAGARGSHGACANWYKE